MTQATDCIFCKIITKSIPTDIVYEDDKCIAINDIHPKDDTHMLILPKKHISTVADADESDEPLLGHLLVTAKRIAKEKQLIGYKLLINVGKEGGQEVFHIHLHLIGH